MKAKEILQKLLNNNYEAYYVGGCVRDHLLNIPVSDYDLTTNATPQQVKEVFGKTVTCGNTFLVSLVDGIEVATYRLDKDDHACHADNLKDDVIRRDFTINGLAMDINQQIIDYVGGVNDIKSRILRFIGDPERRIKEDPVRIIRGLRFMSKFNLTAEYNTHFAIYKLRNLVDTIAKERIQKEVIKAFTGHTAYNFVRLLDEYEILDKIFPSLINLKNLPGGPHHNETVFTHCLNALKSIDLDDKSYQLKLAALYHDTGKADTVTYELGYPRFIDHNKPSCDHAREDFNKLKFSIKDVTFIKNLCLLHMFHILDEETKEVVPKRLKKLMSKLEEKELTLKDFIFIRYADNHSNMITVRPFESIKNQYRQCLKILNEKPPFSRKDLKICGKDLLELGIPEGPEIGKYLKEVFELVLDESLENEYSILLEYIKSQL